MVELSPKWKPLFIDDSRYFLCLGGRGSGKSFSVAYWTMMLTFELNQRILYTRKTLTSAMTSIVPQFDEVIEASGLEGVFKVTKDGILNLHTGSEIIFKGLQTSSGENTAALKSLTGITTVVLDEAEELTDEDLFNKIDLSIRVKNKRNRFVLIMNPTTKEHWTYDRFYIPGANSNCCVIHTNYLDNIDNLSDSFIQEALRMQKVAPKQYEHVFLGAWRDKAEGVIFTNWETGTYPENVKSIFGYDDGYTDPAALVETYIDRENSIIYAREHLYGTGMVEHEKIKKMQEKCSKSLIVAESSAPSVIENARRNNLSIRHVNKKVVTIADSIKEIQKYKIVVDPSSINLIKELNNYVWNDKKSETPKSNGYDHLLDALRYAVGDTLLGVQVHTGLRMTKR